MSAESTKKGAHTPGDLLVKGGLVYGTDSLPAFRRVDVGFANGRVSVIDEDVSSEGYGAVAMLDEGQYLVPGLIDLHGHFYHHGHAGSVDPDVACLPNGVTTAVDAGSCGWATYAGLRRFVIPYAKIRVLAFLNISSVGTLPIAVSGVGELKDLAYLQPSQLLSTAAANPDTVLGFKLRLATDCIEAGREHEVMTKAIEIAEVANLPLMVHVSNTPLPVTSILPMLRSGDIVTHVFNGTRNNLGSCGEQVVNEYLAAQEKGVLFDVAHAGKHFDREVARRCVAQGLIPDSISTDIHYSFSRAVAPRMLGVANDMLDVGMTFESVIWALTTGPARVASAAGEALGTLKVGSVGDACILSRELSPNGSDRLQAVGTVVGGRIEWTRREMVEGN